MDKIDNNNKYRLTISSGVLSTVWQAVLENANDLRPQVEVLSIYLAQAPEQLARLGSFASSSQYSGPVSVRLI